MPSLVQMTGCIAALAAAGCSQHAKQPEQHSISYSVNRCGGAASAWSQQGSEYGELMQHNTLEVGPANLRWNGIAVSAETVREYLGSLKKLRPVGIQVVFEGRTDCRLVNETRALVTDNLHCGSALACVEYNEAEYRAQLASRAVR